MSIIDKVKEAAMNQFIEVIEWLDESQNTLLYRFPVHGQEIKNGAQLIVRESQAAVFVIFVLQMILLLRRKPQAKRTKA